jgi:hypothetical protein
VLCREEWGETLTTATLLEYCSDELEAGGGREPGIDPSWSPLDCRLNETYLYFVCGGVVSIRFQRLNFLVPFKIFFDLFLSK